MTDRQLDQAREAERRHARRRARRDHDGGAARQARQRGQVQVIGRRVADEDQVDVGERLERETGRDLARDAAHRSGQHRIAQHRQALVADQRGRATAPGGRRAPGPASSTAAAWRGLDRRWPLDPPSDRVQEEAAGWDVWCGRCAGAAPARPLAAAAHPARPLHSGSEHQLAQAGTPLAPPGIPQYRLNLLRLSIVIPVFTRRGTARGSRRVTCEALDRSAADTSHPRRERLDRSHGRARRAPGGRAPRGVAVLARRAQLRQGAAPRHPRGARHAS